MSDQRKSTNNFWIFLVIGGIVGFVKGGGAFWLVLAGFGVLLMILGLFNKSKEKNMVNDAAYAFDFDALSSAHKSQLLKQQFGYFLKYRTTGNSELEFYCAEDELDGYRFSFWIEYLVENSFSNKTIRVNAGDSICNVYIYSNKGRAYGCEKFEINAPVSGVVTNFLKGSLQKGLALFRIKEDEVVEIVEEIGETIHVPEIPRVQTTVLFEDVLDDLSIENENIEVEKLEDVLKWEMPDVDDIEMPDEEGNLAYDESLAYHATITNLSDFDWYNFNVICYSGTDDTQKEVKRIGNVRIGAKTLLSSRYDKFYLEGENMQGERKRFRSFTLEKDSDITVTTIFIERD